MFFFQAGRSSVLVVFVSALVACAVPSDPSDSMKARSMACAGYPELIVDPTFITIKDAGSQWKYRQHTGAQSFMIEAQEEVITFERIGS